MWEQLSSGVGAEGAGGASAPQKFWFVENPDKIPENSGTDISKPLFCLFDQWDWLMN